MKLSLLRMGFVLTILFILNGLIAISQPAVLSGTITDALTGTPVVGAKITVGGVETLSVGGGTFSLSVSPGTASATCSKAGYQMAVSNPMNFIQGGSLLWNVALSQFPAAVPAVTAFLDTTVTPVTVPVSWQLPAGECELIYDDGLQDGFTVWAQQGNMNAVRFTPPGYPAEILGGKIHTGRSTDYPAGSFPFVPFQIVVMAADGPGGMPGTILAGPVDVSFNSLGWVGFTLSAGPVISQGDFFLVMIQGGNAPNAAGLAIDNTTSGFRSYSRFVSGANQWIPASGNFMFRATVECPGGPVHAFDGFNMVSGYSIYRLRQGEELNPTAWVPVATTPSTAVNDLTWPNLPCGPYRWGVKALYPAGSVSEVTFSNILGKCWTAGIEVTAIPGCPEISPSGSKITLKNMVYPDTVYMTFTDSSGFCEFNPVWKGTYELKVERFGFQNAIQIIGVSMDSSIQLILQQEKVPPSDMMVEERTLRATWNKPRVIRELFSEAWSSGSFQTNGWSLQGGSNWQIATQKGNPKPSVMFASAPQVSNYEQMLVSSPIHGLGSPALTLYYDLSLDNFGTTTLNQLAVELWNGTEWLLLQHYDNTQGSIPWFSEDADLSAVTTRDFRIRFRATGGDSHDINSWNIDNIRIEAYDDSPSADSCVVGYSLTIDNIACGFVTDTTYVIPPALASFGTVHSACASAIYASGASVPSCASFTSRYLVPPVNLQGIPIGDRPYLTWMKPQAYGKPVLPLIPPPGLNGYIVYRDGVPVDSLNSADSLSYLGEPLFPGSYSFGVAAGYDLSFYGYPGQIDESAAAGPVEVTVLYGLPLPFLEEWTSFSFQSNQWQLEPLDGHWTIFTSDGNPLPCARFQPSVPVSHYSSSLVSQIFLAQNISCSELWFDADIRLTDQSQNSAEHLAIEAFYNNAWHLLEDVSNTGSMGWVRRHYPITAARGGYLQVRFRAFGENSANIQSWEVDNIHIYAVCSPPEELTGEAAGYDVVLIWSSPRCTSGNPLNEGFENETFPPINWSMVQTNPQVTWFHSPASTPMGVHAGSWAAGLSWDYSHQDEWLIAEDVLINGDLTFWSYCYQGSVHQDHYYVKISTDHGQSWTILLDLSDLPPYGTTGYNDWEEPYTIDLSFFTGQTARIAWHAVDGNGLGLWYPWGIDDCRIGSKKLTFFPLSNHIPVAYDIFRESSGTGNFFKINDVPVFDTTYTDMGLSAGVYAYYIAANSPECSSSLTSDTLLVDVITGNEETHSDEVFVFPNPAHEMILVRSRQPIHNLSLFDLTGRKISEFTVDGGNNVRIGLADIPAGVYILSIRTGNDIVRRKIVISAP